MTKSELNAISDQLVKFIPDSACNSIAEMLIAYNVKLNVTRKRKTKLGDFRPPSKSIAYYRISVNGDLNEFMFLLVLLHEFAHLLVWDKFKGSVKSHGNEWKDAYRKLYSRFQDSFSIESRMIIDRHFENLKASTCNDPYLTKHLMHMDNTEEVYLLNDLLPGESFETDGRTFEMINKRRTRFLCKDLVNNKRYLVAGSALVTRLNK